MFQQSIRNQSSKLDKDKFLNLETIKEKFEETEGNEQDNSSENG